MAKAKKAEPAKLVVGAISGHPRAWERARAMLLERFGRFEHETGPIPFEMTGYYAEEMGEGLNRWLVSFERAISQEAVAGIKHEANRMEAEIASAGSWPVPRPVNLDPGYVTLGKMVLATTKDHAHRIAVGEDMYAEVALRFTAGHFEANPWTYADYQQESYLEFFAKVRESLRSELRP